jgi:hypothetical protein
MTAADVVAARVELGYSAAECAESLGVPEEKVAEWEAGQARIPRFSARVLEWHVAMKRRERAIEAAAPKCSWVAERINRPDPDDDAEFQRELDEWDVHAASCPACQDREKWVDTHLGPAPPLPETVSGVVLDAILGLVAGVGRPFLALPEWARLGVAGAVVGFAIYAFNWTGDELSRLFGRTDLPPRDVGRNLRGIVSTTALTGVAGLLIGGINKLFKR